MISEVDLEREEIKRRDKARRDAIMKEKREAQKYREEAYHRLPNEFRHRVNEYYEDFYLGD